MAQRPVQIKPVYGFGAASAALILCLTLGTLAAVALRAEGASHLGPADWAAIKFTVIQALVSALISITLAVPTARALARRRFPGRNALITLLGAPFLLPVIVAVLGLLAVFGRNGLASSLLGFFGFEPIHIYGFHGVVLAHVFFNLPLATRLILHGWMSIPSERFRLAAALGFSASDTARFLERPMLRGLLPGVFLVIFLICLTSFAVALALGGGPKATTVELAIYQAFRFEFDLAKAALLALVQFGLCGAAAVLSLWLTVPMMMGSGLDRAVQRWDADSGWLRLQDTVLLLVATLFLITPLAMITLDGLPRLFSLPTSVFQAAGRSLIVALASAILTLVLALPLALTIAQSTPRNPGGLLLEITGYLSIAASPLVLGTGLFILIFPIADPMVWALPITALVNAVLSLPFALRALVPEAKALDHSYGRLADSLDLKGIARLRLVILPRLRRPMGFSAGLAAALSMGDLGVITLFADPETATLPLQLYRLMAAYRMQDAAGAALLLLGLSLMLFWIFDRGGRVNADT